MADCGELIKEEFPHIDDELYQYIDGKLREREKIQTSQSEFNFCLSKNLDRKCI
jgi:hypothetical protein